jgi:ferredoxin
MHQTVHSVEIDSTRCTGHGRCYALAPEVFASDDQGFVVVTVSEVTDDLLDAAERGASACPERAITVRPAASSGAVLGTQEG